MSSLNLFYFPIVFVLFYTYKHKQFNTITCKQKGKNMSNETVNMLIAHNWNC